MRLEGKTALITGASRNIGREVALTFAREGADLVLNTRSSEAELDEVAGKCRELGVKTHTVIADVSDAASVYKMVEDGIQALGKIDILVSNVAIRPHKPILEVTDEEWHNTLGVNLHSAFYLFKAVLPGMMERKNGSIIVMGGQSAVTGRPDTSMVTTAKTGGTPNTSRPPVIKNPPPTPKKPLRVPRIRPRSSKRWRGTTTPALGKRISNLTVPSGFCAVG